MHYCEGSDRWRLISFFSVRMHGQMLSMENDLFIDSDDEDYKAVNSTLLDKMAIAFAEFLGTAMVVFVSCLGCTHGMATGGVIPSLQMSLTGGLAVMTAITVFAHISGALVNPAVTLCAAIMNQITIWMVPIYIAAQIAGSLVGYAISMAVTPKGHLEVAGGHCVTAPSQEISLLQAFVVEALATLIMCFAICSTWDPRNSNRTDSMPIRIGLVVAMLGMAAGPYTGASMNPARSIGPAVWNLELHYHWIYWLGPITGACITGYFYKMIFLKRYDNK